MLAKQLGPQPEPPDYPIFQFLFLLLNFFLSLFGLGPIVWGL
jgi:hypothetical protein